MAIQDAIFRRSELLLGDEAMERIAQKRLTLEGCIVISVGLFGHSGDEEVWKPGTKEMLDDMHLRKIGRECHLYKNSNAELRLCDNRSKDYK